MSTPSISNLSERVTLNGKRILITGASRGLGAVCAHRFSRLGATLILLARSTDQLSAVIAACHRPNAHRYYGVDLLKLDALGTVMRDVIDSCGQPDVVVHVAGGGLGLRDPLIQARDLKRLFSLNVVAAAEVNRLVAPAMIARGEGVLVHVGSISGNEANASVGYNTVKSALSAYVRSLGNELAGSGVVATGIMPGGFRAPGNSWERLEKSKPEVVDQFIRERLPRMRLADATELLPLLVLLCSGGASMMSGCMVPIDAGEGRAYLG